MSSIPLQVKIYLIWHVRGSNHRVLRGYRPKWPHGNGQGLKVMRSCWRTAFAASACEKLHISQAFGALTSSKSMVFAGVPFFKPALSNVRVKFRGAAKAMVRSAVRRSPSCWRILGWAPLATPSRLRKASVNPYMKMYLDKQFSFYVLKIIYIYNIIYNLTIGINSYRL